DVLTAMAPQRSEDRAGRAHAMDRVRPGRDHRSLGETFQTDNEDRAARRGGGGRHPARQGTAAGEDSEGRGSGHRTGAGFHGSIHRSCLPSARFVGKVSKRGKLAKLAGVGIEIIRWITISTAADVPVTRGSFASLPRFETFPTSGPGSTGTRSHPSLPHLR